MGPRAARSLTAKTLEQAAGQLVANMHAASQCKSEATRLGATGLRSFRLLRKRITPHASPPRFVLDFESDGFVRTLTFVVSRTLDVSLPHFLLGLLVTTFCHHGLAPDHAAQGMRQLCEYSADPLRAIHEAAVDDDAVTAACPEIRLSSAAGHVRRLGATCPYSHGIVDTDNVYAASTFTKVRTARPAMMSSDRALVPRNR